MCVLAIAACESSHLIDFCCGIVCRTLCTGESTTPRVSSVPEALTHKTTPLVWNVSSDGAPDKTCIDVFRNCGAVEGEDDVLSTKLLITSTHGDAPHGSNTLILQTFQKAGFGFV